MKCKTCNKPIKNEKKFCSNKCKFDNYEYNKSRGKKKEKVKNSQNKYLQCKKCGYLTKDVNNHSGHANKHLKEKHNIKTDNYLEYYNIIEKEEHQILRCPECKWYMKDDNNQSGQFTYHIQKFIIIGKNVFLIT